MFLWQLKKTCVGPFIKLILSLAALYKYLLNTTVYITLHRAFGICKDWHMITDAILYVSPYYPMAVQSATLVVLRVTELWNKTRQEENAYVRCEANVAVVCSTACWWRLHVIICLYIVTSLLSEYLLWALNKWNKMTFIRSHVHTLANT